MPATKIIQMILQADQTSIDPNLVVSASNGGIPNISDCPLFLYRCLPDLFGITPSDWPEYVVYKYGDDESNYDLGVDLVYQSQESVDSASNPDKDDSAGSEYGILRTLVHMKDPISDAQEDLVEQADLRIRFLLDITYRQRWYAVQLPPTLATINGVTNPGGLVPYINPVGIDNTLNPKNSILLRWMKEDTLDNAREKASLFSMNFQRMIY